MKAVRGLRALVLALTAALAIFAGLLSSSPAIAAGGGISGQVIVTGGGGVDNLTVVATSETDPSVVFATTTFQGGLFSLGLPDDDYEITIDGGDSMGDYWDEVTIDPASGVVSLGLVFLDPGRKIRGVIRDAVTGAGVPDVAVAAISVSAFPSAGYVPARPFTDATGAYAILVPAVDDDYVVFAFDANGDYYPQFYDHRLTPVLSPCGCSIDGALSVVGPGPFTGIDFDLYPVSDTIYASVYAMKYDGSDYPGVTVILEKHVVPPAPAPATWVLQDQGVTDSHGLVDLLGIGDGDYRLRYLSGTKALKVTKAEESACSCGGGTAYTIASNGTVVLMPGLQTYGTTGTVPTELEPDLTFAKASTPIVKPGPPSKPRSSPFPTSLTGGTSTAPSATPMPTATPTSTPVPSETPAPQPTASPSASAAPDPVPAGDAGFPWWIILLIVLAVGIVVTVIVIVRRR